MTFFILAPRGLALCLKKKRKKKRKKERKIKEKKSLFCTEIYFYEAKVCTVKTQCKCFFIIVVNSSGRSAFFCKCNKMYKYGLHKSVNM